MKKSKLFLILLALLAFGSTAWAQDQTLTLNDGTNLRDEVPIRGWMDREGLGSQFIIPASELTDMQGGTINQLTFYAETASYSFYGAEYKVYITEVDYTEFEPEVFHSIFDIESASYCDWNTMADYYNGGVNISENMMVITLTAPYHYTGGNLLIGIRLTQEGSNADNVNWYGRNQSTVSSVYPLYLGSNEFYFSAKYLPKVTFGYTPSSSAPTCMWPIVTSATVTNHTATIHWTENGEATAWQVCLDDDESNIVDVSTNSYTFTGLDIETTYTAKVRSVCGDDDHSLWSNKVTFTTTEACTPPTNLSATDLTPPHVTVTWDSYGESFQLQSSTIEGGNSKDWPTTTHSYSFENLTISPWTQIDADGDGIMWEINNSPSSYSSYISGHPGHDGNKLVMSGSWSDSHQLHYWADNYLVSPRMMLGGTITFWARQYYNHGGDIINVKVSTTGNTSASDFITVASFTVGHQDWREYTVDLGAYQRLGYVAIHNFHDQYTSVVLVDDITIIEGSNYINCPTNSYTMEVEPNTEYVMRVRTSCGTDGYSDWSDCYSFTTSDVVPVYEINSEEDWYAFAYAVDHGYTYSGETVSLNTDLNGITTMVGASTVIGTYKYFKGTFNGNGHTLNVNYNGEGQWTAPFSCIENATIKNLHVTGTIATTGMRPAGLVGFVSGNSSISSCWSEVAISSSYPEDIDAGGLVGRVNKNKTVNITDCLFSGSIIYSHPDGYEGGGMVGWTQDGATAKLRNCLFAPTTITVKSDNDSYVFVSGERDHVSLNNCYFNIVANSSNLINEGMSAFNVDNETLRAALGDGWEIKDNRVVPIMVYYTFIGEGTEESPYLISTTSDWNGLANNVNLGTTYSGNYFKLMEDISVTTMVGADANTRYFAGIFDGNGHTLTVNLSTFNNEEYVAPFRFVNSVTIKNLHVEGTINASQKYAGGLIGNCTGGSYNNGTPPLILNCCVSTNIISSVNGNGSHGGIIARVYGNCWAIIMGSVFDGSITTTNSTTDCGGFLGWLNTDNNAAIAIFYSLFNPTNTNFTNGCKTFARTNEDDNVIFSCSYYTTTFGSAQGEQAHSISGASYDNGTYVSVTPYGTPETGGDDFNYVIYKVNNTNDLDENYNHCVMYDGTIYTGTGDNVQLILEQIGETPDGYASNDYSSTGTSYLNGMENPYMFTMPNKDVIIGLTVQNFDNGHAGTQEDPYLIYNADQWILMIIYNQYYQNTYEGKYFKLMNDISFSSVLGASDYNFMLGTSEYEFRGTFDGNGHTMTINFEDDSNENFCAPFRYIYGATIKNLHVAGTIHKIDKKNAGGLVGQAKGNNNIINCRSSVDIFFDDPGDCSSGGFIGEMRYYDGTSNIDNCVFDGILRGTGAYKWGGFIGWIADGCTANLTNCLFDPTQVSVYDNDNYTFARYDSGDAPNLTNCYYTQFLGTPQGKEALPINADENVIVENAGTPVVAGTVSGITGYGVGIKYNDVLYAGTGENVSLNLSCTPPPGCTAGNYVASAGTLNGTANPYTLAMPNTEVTISVNLVPAEWDGTGAEDDPYLIYNEGQWQMLANRVNNGTSTYSGKFFKLMDDISVTDMVGGGDGSNNLFSGTFNGDGHTITFHKANASQQYIAPFRRIDGATIMGVRLTGTVSSSSRFAGGIVAYAKGTSTVINCINNTHITGTMSGSASHGGIVGMVGASGNLTISGCIFNGQMMGTAPDDWCGILGLCNSNCTATISDCLFIPTSANVFGYTIHRTTGSTTLSNCYYTQTMSTNQGKLLHSIISDNDDITLAFAGTATEYNVSGITSYGMGFMYDDMLFAGNSDNVSLNLTASDSYTIGIVTYTPEGGTTTEIVPVEGVYSFIMPDADVVINADLIAGVTQTVVLAAGVSWWSTNLDITLDQLKVAIADALGTTGTATIKSHDGAIKYSNGQWRGAGIQTLDVRQMYEIQTNMSCEITLVGTLANPLDYEIAINPGNNWIGFLPNTGMTLLEAFGTFPINGDMVTSKSGSSVYHNGQWRGQLGELEPGHGYIYKSASGEARTFTYPVE